MRKFFKDYKELWKHSWSFTKEHWFGMTVFTIVLWLIEMAVIFPDLFRELFKKKEFEED